MRPIEAVLSCINLLAFSSFVVLLPHNLRWLHYTAPITLLIAILQIIVEGPRWQMVPAYLLALVYCLIWLSGLVMPNGLHLNRFAAVIVIGVAGLLVSIVLPIVLPVFHFPKPTGQYAIGTTTYHWVDTSRPELFTPELNDHRELMAQVWYPARSGTAAPQAPYIEDADFITPALAQAIHLPGFLFTHFKYVKTNAVVSAPVVDDETSFPVLIFLSGRSGFRQVNTFQIEELVSQGYIVVGLDQPGAVVLTRFPDGRQVSVLPPDQFRPLIQQSIEPLETVPTLFGKAMPEGILPYFADDVPFTLDQLVAINQSDPNHILTGQLDLKNVGVFGISLGGANAAEACLKDSRLKACLIMDVYMPADVVRQGLRQPVMWLTRDADTMRQERASAGGWTEKDIEQHQTTMRAVYEKLEGDGYYVQIPRIFHLNFTDFPYWSPIFQQIGLIGPIDSQRAFNIVNTYSVAFFDKYLKGKPSPLLEGATKPFPEVTFESHH